MGIFIKKINCPKSKSMNKRVIVSGMLCAVMVLCSACGNTRTTEVNSSTSAESEANLTFRINDLEINNPDGGLIPYLYQVDDGIYGLQQCYGNEEVPGSASIVKYTGEKAGQQIVIKTEDGVGNYSYLAMDDVGNFYSILSVYNSQDTTIVENSDGTQDVYYIPDQYVVKIASDGNIVWKMPVNEEDKSDNMGLSGMVYAKGVGIVTVSDKGMSVFDSESSKEERINSDILSDYSFGKYSCRKIYALRDGSVYLMQTNEKMDSTLYKYDSKKQSFSEVTGKCVKDNLEGGSLYPGKSYDFLVNRYDGIYGFDIDGENLQKICDYISSDITINYGINEIFEEDEDNLFVVSFDVNDYDVNYVYSRLTRDDAIASEKETLTMATVFASDGIRNAVANFNRNNDKYKIVLKDYYDPQYYLDGLERLNLDIVSGNGPDIIDAETVDDFDNYINKGLFIALDDYFYNDEELSGNTYFKNVIECGKRKGKLYTLIPHFAIDTCIADSEMMNGETLTWSNYEEFCQKRHVDPAMMFGDMSQEDSGDLYWLASMEFVDNESGTCDFTNPSFINLLDYISILPEESDENENISMYRDKKAILLPANIYSIEDYVWAKNLYFDEDVVYNGLPAVDRADSFINPTMQLAISSTCKNKDVAWEFTRYFLTDDFQDKIDGSLPVSEKAFKALLKKAQDNSSYVDENGEEHESLRSISMNGYEVEIDAITENEANQFYELAKSITEYSPRNEDISDIIYEEASAYLAGQKSSEEVASIIQSRVSLYLSEHS